MIINNIHVPIGGLETASGESSTLTTVLGSCVATCIYFPELQIGGMNHYMLATKPLNLNSPLKELHFGVNSIPALIYQMKQLCGNHKLVAKIAGGGNKTKQSFSQENIDLARKLLQENYIEIIAEDVGGEFGRKVRFWPGSGLMEVAKLKI